MPYYRVSNVKRQMSDVALVFGNEVRGLTPAIPKRADKITGLRLSAETLKRLEKVAKANNCSTQDAIRFILDQQLFLYE